MLLKSLSLFVLLIVCVFGYELNTNPVNTPVGRIFGLDAGDYNMFLGIPYGLIDEKNPFGNARPHPPFKTPRAAYDDSVICPQYDKGVIKGTIQCLQLNIYTPKDINPRHTFPVMVYIHGGAFAEGNGALRTYSPKFLMRHDVIFVTVNYRLGPYGHLCLPNTEFSNQALKDQNLALQWVKNNIESFGGDSNNILLFGHSSGSVSSELQLLYSKEIVFNKIILQSGHAVTPYLNEATTIKTFFKDVGMDTENISVYSFVQTISTIDTNTVINITKHYNFRPCIDGEFVTKTPKSNNLQNMKLMIGGTSKEMLYFFPRADREFYDNFDFVADLKKGFLLSKMADSAEAVDVIKHFYFDNLKENIIDFVSDYGYNYPMERSVKYYLNNNNTVYRYLFPYEGGRNYMKIRENISTAGSTHGDELGYLFDIPLLSRNITEEDQVIIDRFSELWTNFAKYGDPTPTPTHLLPIKWKPVTTGARPYLQIDTNLGVHTGPFHKRMAFWDLYYAKYGMYAKGISLGEKYTEHNIGLSKSNSKSKASSLELCKLLLLTTVLLLWQ